MPQVAANGIAIEVETHGNPDDPAILLIMGYSAQLIYWPPDFIAGLVAAGFHVITFDNRDIGLSTKFDEAKAPRPALQVIGKKLLRNRQFAPYSLEDMAADAVGVLDALDIDRAHMLGVSMGGMIGQVMAAKHGKRLLSFTAVMTSTNAPGLPRPSAEVGKVMMETAKAKATTPEQSLEIGMAFASAIISEESRSNIAAREAIARASVERSFYPPGPKRQMAAIIETGDLSRFCRAIELPTLVIHGADDPLILPAAGRDVAAKIPGARFVAVDGMAHDLPPSKLGELTELVVEHCRSVEVVAV